MANSYPLLADLKTFVAADGQVVDSTNDYVLTLCLNAATDNVNRFCNQTFTNPNVPAGVSLAILTQANRYYHRRSAWAGVAGSPDMGNEVRLLAALDPDVQVQLRPNKLYWWVGVGV